MVYRTWTAVIHGDFSWLEAYAVPKAVYRVLDTVPQCRVAPLRLDVDNRLHCGDAEVVEHANVAAGVDPGLRNADHVPAGNGLESLTLSHFR